MFVLKTSLVLLLSEGAAILSVVFTASLTTLSGHSLSYYSRPYLIIPLFYLPAILSMGAIHYWWRQKVLYNVICTCIQLSYCVSCMLMYAICKILIFMYNVVYFIH